MCLKYKSESGCAYGEKCRFRHAEADGQPSKKSKKSGVRGPVALLKESFQMGCVSQDSHPKNSILRKEGKLGLNHTVAPHLKIAKERVHREATFKSVNLTSEILALPGLRKGHKTKPCTKEDAPAE